MKLYTNNLSKKFSFIWALKDINIDIDSSLIAILGPNGSGKTTLLSIISGLRYPTKGVLKINDIIPYKDRDKALKFISFMFEKPRFRVGIKVKDLVKFVEKIRGCKADADKLIDILELNTIFNKRMNQLSSGQLQICGLFIAICGWGYDDKIIVLDEPLIHLDFKRSSKLINYLSDRNIIFTTHAFEEAEALANYFIILDGGEVVWEGDRRKLFSSDIYEIYVSNLELGEKIKSNRGIKILYSYGNNALVKADPHLLSELVENGTLLGYRKAGVKYVYTRHKVSS